ncbi:MAG: phosphoribosyl-AMP cyclohydrolase [Candidatus Diapherotrites archaeon]
MIIPSIDLMQGKAVQLTQGKKKKIEKEVNEMLEKFSLFEEIQVIDLDKAIGKGENTALVKELCKKANCRAGGGIRNSKYAKELIEAGAKKIIIGTKANKKFLEKLNKEIPKEKIICAIDAWKRKIVVEGWRKKTNQNVFDKVKELEEFCGEFLFTAVEKEGLMQGIDFDSVKKIREITKNKIAYAGGIKSMKEIETLESIGVSSIVGMAIYSGKINLNELKLKEKNELNEIEKNEKTSEFNALDFNKMNGLIPVIVQDIDSKEILMQAYANKEAIQKTINSGKATYWSRSRKELWVKGLTSGNTQGVKKILFDCDGDCLIYLVKPKGPACHTNAQSCFFREIELNEN